MAGKCDSFGRSGGVLMRSFPLYTLCRPERHGMQPFYSFGRSREMAGKCDSFGRSEKKTGERAVPSQVYGSLSRYR